jgi:hypothetical protein
MPGRVRDNAMTPDPKLTSFRWICSKCGTARVFTEDELRTAREIAKGPIPALWCQACGANQPAPNLAEEIAAWDRERRS